MERDKDMAPGAGFEPARGRCPTGLADPRPTWLGDPGESTLLI